MVGNPKGKKVVTEQRKVSLVFQVLSDVKVGECITLGRRDEVLVAGYSFKPMQGAGLGLRGVTRDDVFAVASCGNKKRLKPKQRLAASKAWSTIQKAQSARRVTAADHPEVYKALHARQACEYPDGDDLRKLLLQKYKFLTIGAGLEIRASEAHQCNGLFTLVGIPRGKLVTYYDGVEVALGEEALERHREREGWFICTGRTSSNSPVLVGFTSEDRLTSPCAGVMSLTNSAPASHANCARADLEGQPYRLGDAFLDTLICLRAKRDIRAGEELTWEYNVR